MTDSLGILDDQVTQRLHYPDLDSIYNLANGEVEYYIRNVSAGILAAGLALLLSLVPRPRIRQRKWAGPHCL